jgi:hypothetical protein
MAGVMDNIGGAMSMASTGLVVMGAAVPLKMLQNMADSRKTSTTTKKKRKKKTKKSKGG